MEEESLNLDKLIGSPVQVPGEDDSSDAEEGDIDSGESLVRHMMSTIDRSRRGTVHEVPGPPASSPSDSLAPSDSLSGSALGGAEMTQQAEINHGDDFGKNHLVESHKPPPADTEDNEGALETEESPPTVVLTEESSPALAGQERPDLASEDQDADAGVMGRQSEERDVPVSEDAGKGVDEGTDVVPHYALGGSQFGASERKSNQTLGIHPMSANSEALCDDIDAKRPMSSNACEGQSSQSARKKEKTRVRRPKRPIGSFFTPDELRELRMAFSLFDKNGDGTITKWELRQAMLSVGKNMSTEEIMTMMRGTDEDGDGEIDFDEFLALMKPIKQQQQQELKVAATPVRVSNMRRVFDVFDRDHNGFITADELRSLFAILGESLTDEEALRMVAVADENNDGRVSYSEFFKLFSLAEGMSQS